MRTEAEVQDARNAINSLYWMEVGKIHADAFSDRMLALSLASSRDALDYVLGVPVPSFEEMIGATHEVTTPANPGAIPEGGFDVRPAE